MDLLPANVKLVNPDWSDSVAHRLLIGETQWNTILQPSKHPVFTAEPSTAVNSTAVPAIGRQLPMISRFNFPFHFEMNTVLLSSKCIKRVLEGWHLDINET